MRYLTHNLFHIKFYRDSFSAGDMCFMDNGYVEIMEAEVEIPTCINVKFGWGTQLGALI